MDEIDVTVEVQQRLLDRQVEARKPAGPPAIGKCYFCSSPLKGGQRWCDEECRNEWQDLQARRAMR